MWYNDNDPYACSWLRSLVAAGHLPRGVVDGTSITDIVASELGPTCHFFAGIGGWPLALELAGWEGDVWTGSCPCQPFSVAGQQKEESDERHLWPAFFDLISKCKPPTIFGEQVSGASGYRWFAGVRSDLERAGYRVGAADLPAACVGAPHIRQRLFWVADTERDVQRRQEPCCGEAGRVGRIEQCFSWDRGWKDSLPIFRAVDDGFPRRVGATDAIRNALVPAVAAEFVSAYMEAILG